MKERREVRAVKIVLYCDKCGGEMKSFGEALGCYPPLYDHFCEEGHRSVEKHKYPRIVFEEEGHEP